MVKEKLYTLIKAPIITEKSAQLSEKYKQVIFKVDLDANKREIKQAVESFLLELVGQRALFDNGSSRSSGFHESTVP